MTSSPRGRGHGGCPVGQLQAEDTRRSKRRWSLFIGRSLAICLLCGAAIAPLFCGESPCSHDGGLHYFRIAAMRHALDQGTFFSRWLPDLAFGYGFPFFNYRAPLSYYLALGLHLTGLPLPLALNLVYGLSILGSALGAYLLGRDLFGAQAGVVAAVAYAYAPYQFADALVRANAPESVALALMPLILWAFRRLALEGGRRWFLASVGLLTALYLNHNISSLSFTPVLLAYLGLLAWIYRRRGQWGRVALALALALGLTAFFWLPALVEKEYVQIYLTGANRNNDFHYNFLGLAEILAPPTLADTSLINPPMRIHLGLVQAVLAGVGLIMGTLRAREQGSTERQAAIIFFATSAAVMVFMSTRASVWLWEHLPLLAFVQFPWRFIGRAALPVALLAGTVAQTQQSEWNAEHVSGFAHYASRAVPSILVAVLMLAALPSTYPPGGYCPMAPRPTVMDVHRYEHQSGLVGVDPVGAYFPIWVQRRPEGSPLETQYAAGGPVARFDETVLPEGAEVREADYAPNHARLVVKSPTSFRARYLTFYFPGWQVSVDGEQVRVTPSDPEGLITFNVPAGRHTVAILFGETPLRLASDAVSALALVSLLVVGVAIPTPESPRSPSPRSPASLLAGSSVPLLLAALFLLVYKLAVTDPANTPFHRHRLRPDGTLPGVEQPLNQPYADGLTLIGYDQSTDQMSGDGILRLHLYWTARERPSHRYQTVLHLVGANGLRWSPQDSFRPRGYHDAPAANTWGSGRYAVDSHEIELLPCTPPGIYDVVLTVFDRDTLAPLSLLNEQGQPAAPELSLQQVTLAAPGRPADPDRLGIEHRLDVCLGPLTLLGADFNRAQASPGDPVFLTTFWQARERPVEDFTLRLALLAPDGSSVAEYDLPPTAAWHSTSTWHPGDVWRGQHLVHLPAALDTAIYTWTLSLSPPSRPPLSLSPLSVTAPDRTFTARRVDREVSVELGSVATLLGGSVQPEGARFEPGAALTVTLVWRAEAEMRRSYHVFVHLIGPDGALVAQSDGIPAGWTRPTTGWLPGEYITDVRTLTLPVDAPAGEYALSIGLYVPGGERLTAPSGAGAISLTTIVVEGR